jgi:hypothetical protein
MEKLVFNPLKKICNIMLIITDIMTRSILQLGMLAPAPQHLKQFIIVDLQALLTIRPQIGIQSINLNLVQMVQLTL